MVLGFNLNPPLGLVEKKKSMIELLYCLLVYIGIVASFVSLVRMNHFQGKRTSLEFDFCVFFSYSS